MKYVPVYHGIPAVLHRDEPWLHRHSEKDVHLQACEIYKILNLCFRFGSIPAISDRKLELYVSSFVFHLNVVSVVRFIHSYITVFLPCRRWYAMTNFCFMPTAGFV